MIPVVFSSDHDFIMPTGVALQSMLESAPKVEFDIFILQSDDVTDMDRNRLQDIVKSYKAQISFISFGKEFSESYEVRGISTACYFRLLIPWLITQYDRVIYLDGDTVVKSDISKLLDYFIDDDAYAYGVRTPGFSTDADLVNYITSLGLTNVNYINSGILVLNSKLLRKDNLKDKFLSYRDKALLYQDQDIINIVCKDRIGWLPLKFNRTPSLEGINKSKLIEAGVTTDFDFEDAILNPAIIHYAGKKPWKTFTYHWYDWWSVYSRSPFYNTKFAFESATRILNPDYSLKRLTRMLIKKLIGK